LWYLRYRDRRYLFSAKPNLNKVILDFESEVSEEGVNGALKDWLDKLAGRGAGVFQMVVAPQAPELVPDRAQPTLVVLPLDAPDAREWMMRAMQSAGEGLRTNKNMLVFLVPNTARLAALRAAVRRWLALEDVAQSSSFKEMDKEDQEQVKDQLKDKVAEVEALLLQAYQDIYRPGDSGVTRITSVSPEAIKVKTLDEFVKEALERAGILLERVAPEYLKETLQIDEAREVPLSQASNLFTGVAGQPVPRNPHEAVHQAVREGVQQGLFGVRVGEQFYLHQEVPEEVLKSPGAVLIAPEAPPPQPLTLERRAITLRVRTSANLLYPLLQAAQQLKDLRGASVSLEVHDPTGEMARMRAELEKLLRDYGCTVEWPDAAE